MARAAHPVFPVYLRHEAISIRVSETPITSPEIAACKYFYSTKAFIIFSDVLLDFSFEALEGLVKGRLIARANNDALAINLPALYVTPF